MAENPENNTKAVPSGKKLALPIILTIVFFLLVILAHDFFVKNEYIQSLKEIYQQISAYRQQNPDSTKFLPDRKYFLQNITIKSRNLGITNIQYLGESLHKDSPPDSVLAFTPQLNLRLFPSGHAVLYLDGRIDWVRDNDMHKLIGKNID